MGSMLLQRLEPCQMISLAASCKQDGLVLKLQGAGTDAAVGAQALLCKSCGNRFGGDPQQVKIGWHGAIGFG
jgi:hypothetical protein